MNRKQEIWDTVKSHAIFLGVIVAVLWIIEIIDQIPGINLDNIGIRPRTMEGLVGVLLAPIIHTDFTKLAENTILFIILGGIILISGRKRFCAVTIIVTIISGGAVWLMGEEGSVVHIGLSGVIFGYFGYLLLRGYFEKSVLWVGIAVFVTLVYGSLLFALLPSGRELSWLAPFFGFIGGVATAASFSKGDRKNRKWVVA